MQIKCGRVLNTVSFLPRVTLGSPWKQLLQIRGFLPGLLSRNVAGLHLRMHGLAGLWKDMNTEKVVFASFFLGGG